MKYNPDRNNRRSIRIPEFDYSSPGMYFITICTNHRVLLFGDIVDGEMVLNEYGDIVFDEWIKSTKIRHEIELDEFIIMPNHLHGIINIVGYNHGRGDRPFAPTNPDGTILPKGPYPKSIGSMIAGFKSAVTKQINIIRQTPGSHICQRNYGESHAFRHWEHLPYEILLLKRTS
jgi:putative transposase